MATDLVYIYYHKNLINGKYYIGQTVNPKQRWANKEHNYKCCTKFYRAIKKYGWNSFEHHVICTCEKWEADLLEQAFIKKYDSVKNGYNLTYGGKAYKDVSQETRDKISKANKGKKKPPFTAEHKQHIKEARARQIVKPMPEGAKESISKAAKERYKSEANRLTASLQQPTVKAILQYDLNMRFIKEWRSAKEVQFALGICGTVIKQVCEGLPHRNTAGGYIWRYKDEQSK